MTQKLQIVAFDNPFPPNYGGVIDVFYQIKALAALGVSIELHCFTDTRRDFEVVESFCDAVYTYPKTSRFKALFSKKPIALATRENRMLTQRLSQSDAPVLLQGLQSAVMLVNGLGNSKAVYLRIQNIEQQYYRGLANAINNPLKALIYNWEARKFESFEPCLKSPQTLFTLSHHEQHYYSQLNASVYVPVFHENEIVQQCSEFGEFALYHGNLSVADNLKTACFLIDVFKEVDYPLVIAGSFRQELIQKKIKNYKHMSFEPIETAEKLDALLARAHITLNLSFQRSGTKLKVMNALFKSRHCIVNENVIDEPEALAASHLCTSAVAIQEKVRDLRSEPFTEFEKRQKLLDGIFNNRKNAQKIKQSIFREEC